MKSMLTTVFGALLVLLLPRLAAATTPLDLRLTHANYVGDVAAVAAIVEYDHANLLAKFGMSGDLRFRLVYHSIAMDVSSWNFTTTLDPSSGSLIIGPLAYELTESHGLVTVEVFVSLGAQNVRIARQPLFFHRDGEDSTLGTHAEYLAARRLRHAVLGAHPTLNLEPGDVPGERRGGNRVSKPCEAEETCLQD